MHQIISMETPAIDRVGRTKLSGKYKQNRTEEWFTLARVEAVNDRRA